MNYWLLTTEYPPFYGGGISTYCRHTAEMLAAKGHRVSVFVNDNTVRSIGIERQGNIRVIRFNPSSTQSSYFLGYVTNISYEFAHVVMTFIQNEGRPDIIESQEYLGIAYYLLQYKRLLYEWCKDIPILITMHSPSFLYMEYNHVPEYRYPNFWICEMERFCLQAADHIISPSQYMIDELEKRFSLTNKNISVVPNPYDIKSEASGSNSRAIKQDEIVFFGKLTAQKGAFELLEYFKELWDSGFARPLYIIGGQDILYNPEGISMGDLIRKRYKKYITSGLLLLENGIGPEKIANRLASAEVVIIPSNNDNLPYVVFEMMALGKVVLVSKQGGQAEVVTNGEDGFIFDHSIPGSFASQLLKLLGLDAVQLDKIKAKAVQRVRQGYGHNITYDRKIKVIEGIIQKKPAKTQFPFVRPVTDRPKTAMPANKLLSVVIPYFNMGKYIDDTISSIERSDYPEKEIIIVNDGSSLPESIARLEPYRSRAGVRVIDTVNQGLAKARNTGVSFANGQYLAFLDADDMVMPEYFSRAVSVLASYENVDFVGCWTRYFQDSVAIWPAFQPEPPLILFHNMVNSSALVYKKESFLATGLNDSKMLFQGLEDYESVVSMIGNGYNGVVLPEILFNYRVRSNSMIRKISRSKKLLLHQYIAKKHSKVYAKFATDIFGLLNANGTGILLDNPTLDYHLADKMPFKGRISQHVIRLVKQNRHTKKIAYKIYRFLKK